MAQIYNMVSIAAFCIAGTSFLLSIIFWFRFHIPALIGDLSGRTAKKSIEEMRKRNEKNKQKMKRPEKKEIAGKNMGIPDTFVMIQSPDINSTDLIGQLPDDSEQTTLLTEGMLSDGKTTLLSEGNTKFTMVQNLVLLHTKEQI